MQLSSAVEGKKGAEGVAERYGEMVYGAALRQMGDREMALDVMQAVFVVLLRKMERGKGPAEGRMAGWLLEVTRYVVKEAKRGAWRRKRREVVVREVPAMQDAREEAEIRESLDAALMTLGAVDREVLVRRYLRGEEVARVGAAVGLTENATSKRIGRALEKMRGALARQGVTAPMGAIVGVMGVERGVKVPVVGGGGVGNGEALARRVLWRAMVVQGVGVVGAVLVACAITAGVVVLRWRSGEVVVAASAPAATTQEQEERLVQVGAVMEESSDRLVGEILAGIEENRGKLKNIEIEATYTTSQRTTAVADAFVESQMVGKGWIERKAPGRFRAEISFARLPWLNGAAPFLDDSFSETWDGEAVRDLHTPAHSIVRAEITGGEVFSKARNIFGRDYSLQLIQRLGTATSEDLLDSKRLRKMRLAGRRVMMNGRQTMELEVRYNIPTSAKGALRDELARHATRYWFDPRRGYALMGHVEGEDGELPTKELVVDDVTEAATGVFYPVHGRMIRYTRNRETRKMELVMRAEFRATRVVANQEIDPAIFHIEFPEGVAVEQHYQSVVVMPATRP